MDRMKSTTIFYLRTDTRPTHRFLQTSNPRPLDLVYTTLTARSFYKVHMDIVKQQQILVCHVITMNYTIPVIMHDTLPQTYLWLLHQSLSTSISYKINIKQCVRANGMHPSGSREHLNVAYELMYVILKFHMF